jgi:signal transduction histidine kinase
MLHEFISMYRAEIIDQCRVRVAARKIPPVTEAEIDHGVPVFLNQLGTALRLGSATPSPEISRSAIQHGRELQALGFSVSQVVHDYGDVCQTITELAVEKNMDIEVDDFRLLNRCLDEAIAGAVTEYGREQREQDESTRKHEAMRENERFGFLTHELRNRLNTALVAFDVLASGKVGLSGSTGTVLHRSLLALRDLINHSLDDVRHARELVQKREQFLVSHFIEELTPTATLAAHDMDITLTVLPVEAGVTIQAVRAVLEAIVMNLLQNAFKFTKPHTTVTLRVGASTERVLIEVQDECGGLPTGNANDLFDPFEQRSANRTGLGLGLAFSRWGAESNNGRIYTRNLPGEGCIFIIDLPRVNVPDLATAES